MGTGDWNDGMNRVGHEGRGESVWLGWFLHTTLWEFARLADARGEPARAERGGPTCAPLKRRSSSTPGTATGTGAPTSTTARRSAPPRTTNAASTRSPSRGR